MFHFSLYAHAQFQQRHVTLRDARCLIKPVTCWNVVFVINIWFTFINCFALTEINIFYCLIKPIFKNTHFMPFLRIKSHINHHNHIFFEVPYLNILHAKMCSSRFRSGICQTNKEPLIKPLNNTKLFIMFMGPVREDLCFVAWIIMLEGAIIRCEYCGQICTWSAVILRLTVALMLLKAVIGGPKLYHDTQSSWPVSELTTCSHTIDWLGNA